MDLFSCCECDTGEYKLNNYKLVCKECGHSLDADYYLTLVYTNIIKEYEKLLKDFRKDKEEAVNKENNLHYDRCCKQETQILEAIETYKAWIEYCKSHIKEDGLLGGLED